VTFNKAIKVPDEIYNLTSENDGAKIFNITLIIHEENLKELNLQNTIHRRSRRLSADDFYEY